MDGYIYLYDCSNNHSIPSVLNLLIMSAIPLWSQMANVETDLGSSVCSLDDFLYVNNGVTPAGFPFRCTSPFKASQ